MAVQFRLKELAQEFGIQLHGKTSDIQEALGVERQTVSRLINSRTSSVSFEHLQRLSDWLLKNVDPSKRPALQAMLPGALFSFTGIWERLVHADELTAFLGERCSMPNAKISLGSPRWIAGADAEAATGLIHGLTQAGGRFQFKWKNIPFHYDIELNNSGSTTKPKASVSQKETAKLLAAQLDKDTKEVARLHGRMMKNENRANIIIGSQRINLLVEQFVASLFSATPFKERHKNSTVPFYLQYRPDGYLYPKSCFGGDGARAGVSKNRMPGIHYKSSKTKWAYIPWEQSKTTSGITIIHQDLSLNSVAVALIGYSREGTLKLSQLFQDDPRRFGPLHEISKDRRLGVFACQFDRNKNNAEQKTPGIAAEGWSIVALSKDVICKKSAK
ncbi:MAG: helix-turn-helix transcriptional regulator [Planctomycetota bacterium]